MLRRHLRLHPFGQLASSDPHAVPRCRCLWLCAERAGADRVACARRVDGRGEDGVRRRSRYKQPACIPQLPRPCAERSTSAALVWSSAWSWLVHTPHRVPDANPTLLRLPIPLIRASPFHRSAFAAATATPSGKQDFLEASPYSDQSNVPVNTYKNKAPHTGKVVSTKRIVGAQATGETCHIIIDHFGKMPYWEGQSAGVIAPGTNPKNGKPNSVRLYSIAASRYGDDMTGQTTSLCVRRATYWCPELKADDPAKKGICSNFLCDTKPGDEVKLTGPSGKVMLIPEKDPNADLIMVSRTRRTERLCGRGNGCRGVQGSGACLASKRNRGGEAWALGPCLMTRRGHVRTAPFPRLTRTPACCLPTPLLTRVPPSPSPSPSPDTHPGRHRHRHRAVPLVHPPPVRREVALRRGAHTHEH